AGSGWAARDGRGVRVGADFLEQGPAADPDREPGARGGVVADRGAGPCRSAGRRVGPLAGRSRGAGRYRGPSSRRTDIDGMVVGRFRLAPADAAAVIAAIDSSVMAYRGPAHASADASAVGTQRWPSVSQQRADALVGLVTGGGLGVTTEVVLHVRGDGCSLDDGTPLAG